MCSEDSLGSHLNYVLTQVHNVTSASCLRLANWDPRYSSEFSSHGILKVMYKYWAKTFCIEKG